MQELLKNLFYLGAGAAFMTKEKLEEVRNELVEKGNLTREEGKQFVDDLLSKSDDLKGKLDERVNQIVEERLAKMNIARREDIVDLQEQVQELRGMVEQLKKN